MHETPTTSQGFSPELAGRGIRRSSVLGVIVALSLLVGLLLPAIARNRDVARRAQCQNNLKQLALATCNYEFTYKRLPVGIQVSPGSSETWDTRAGNWSWLWFVDVFAERASSYDVIDPHTSCSLADILVVEAFRGNLRSKRSAPRTGSGGTKAEQGSSPDRSLEATLSHLQGCPSFPSFLCPSDSRAAVQNDLRHGVTDSNGRTICWPDSSSVFNLGISNYVAANSSRDCYAMIAGAANGETYLEMPDGLFHAAHATRLDDVVDGLSNTVMASERTYGSLTSRGDRRRFGRVINAGAGTVFGARGIGNSSMDGSATNDCADAWGAPDVLFSAWGGINLDDPDRPWRKFQGVSSFHPGGVNIVMADGSTHFLAIVDVPEQLGAYEAVAGPDLETATARIREDRLKSASIWRLMISMNDGADRELLD